MKAGVGDDFSKGPKPSWGSGPTTGWKHQREANNLVMNWRCREEIITSSFVERMPVTLSQCRTLRGLWVWSGVQKLR